MEIVNHENFKNNPLETLTQAIKFKETVHISSPDGEAVLMNAEEYYDLLEQLHIAGNPYLMAKVEAGHNESWEDAVPRGDLRL